MNAVARLLVIWLLALAVPVQGAAAATMAFCGLAHQPAVAGAQAQAAMVAHGHGHDASAHHAHHGDAPAQGLAVPAAPGHDGQHQCSACAACCSFGAMLGPVWSVPAPVFGAGVFVDVVPSVGPFSTDGPDRPPRRQRA